MPNLSIQNRYVFISPFASSIYPILSPDETLSLLHELNASLPPEKRLPVEILLHVNKELHTANSSLEDIRATWAPITSPYQRFSFSFMDSPPVVLNDIARRYYIRETSPLERDETSIRCLQSHVSSADLLYRLRCYFPEVNINVGAYKTVWRVLIAHNQTGLFLRFSEFKGGHGAELHVLYDRSGLFLQTEYSDQQEALYRLYADLVRLLNALFFEAADWNHRQFAFYHPAADADFPKNDSDQHYIAVPIESCLPREEEDEEVYGRWHLKETSATDVSFFPSLLQDLKYNVASRKVDRLNGTANLTTEQGNVNAVPPITSVWQVQFAHRETGASIIFMDDRGLFDIRGGEGIKEVMGDVEALVESLCSDTCIHPYHGTVAGTVA